jgi:hypothetical protein
MSSSCHQELFKFHSRWMVKHELNGRLIVTTRTALGPARKLHLDRAARTAGEAFAFDEPDAMPAPNRSYGSSLVWLSMAAAAVLGLALVF